MARQKIGRAEDCEYRINDLSVSRNHAEIEKLGANRFLLRDLDSTYGTKVYREGEWVEILEIEIKKDTPIRFGDHETTVAALMGGAIDDEIETGKQQRVAKPETPAADAKTPAAEPEKRAAEPPPQKGAAGAAAPKGRLGKRVKPARPTKTGSNRTLWLIVGGFGALVVVVAITAAALYFLNKGPSEAEIRAEFAATCQARGTTPERCQCEVGFIMDRASRREQRVLLFVAQNRDQPERLRAYLNENFTAEERNLLRGRINQLILGIEAQCAQDGGQQEE
jgi:hypothetical protein